MPRDRNDRVHGAGTVKPSIRTDGQAGLECNPRRRLHSKCRVRPNQRIQRPFRRPCRQRSNRSSSDHGDLWGAHLFSQSQHEARTQLVGDRLKRQLALETSGLLKPFYDLVVEDVGATGSDLFLREGSDVTVLFRFRQPAVFKAQMEQLLAQAAKSQPNARRSQGECLGVLQCSLPNGRQAWQTV